MTWRHHLTSHSYSIYRVMMVLHSEHLQRCCTWNPSYNKPPVLPCYLTVSLWENRRHHMLLSLLLGSVRLCFCVWHPLCVILSFALTLLFVSLWALVSLLLPSDGKWNTQVDTRRYVYSLYNIQSVAPLLGTPIISNAIQCNSTAMTSISAKCKNM